MKSNPFSTQLISPLALRIPSGELVSVLRCNYHFVLWQGQPIEDSYGGKVVLDFDGRPVFAELAILRVLQRAGWDGVWVDTYRRKFRCALPPDSCELPAHAQELYDRICNANGGRASGCFDVFAWNGPDYLFIEAKRLSRDVIQPTQGAWVGAAMMAGVPLDSLLICEWSV